MTENATIVRSCALRGVEAVPVEVEVSLGPGMPRALDFAGAWGTALAESRTAIRCALRSAGFELPRAHMQVSIRTAGDLRIPSPRGLELPIAAGILAASGQIPSGWLDGAVLSGALELDGSASPVRGSVSAQLAARDAGVPLVTSATAEVIDPVLAGEVLGIGSIAQLRAGLDRAAPVAPRQVAAMSHLDPQARVPLRAARALAAAAGRQGIMASGDADTVADLARALASIMPPMGEGEIREQAMVLSAAGKRLEGALGTRPVREIRLHDAAAGASLAAIVGGGRPVAPGEVSLAHGGVLLVADAEGLSKTDCLRLSVVRHGEVEIVRADGICKMPAASTVVARVGDRPLPDPLMRRVAADMSGIAPLWVDLSSPEGLAPGPTVAELRAEVAAARSHEGGESPEASELLARFKRAYPALAGDLSPIAGAICDLDRRDRVELHDLLGGGALMHASRSAIVEPACAFARQLRDSRSAAPAPTAAQLREALAGIPSRGADSPAEGRRRHV